MATAVSNHDWAQTLTAAEDIEAGRFVCLTDDGQVATPGTTNIKNKGRILGVAHLGGQAGKHCPVIMLPGQVVVVKSNFGTSTAIAAGDIVKADGDGKAVKVNTTSDPIRIWDGIVLGPEKATADADINISVMLL